MRIYVCDLDLLDDKGLGALWVEAMALRTSIRRNNTKGWMKHPMSLPIMLSSSPLLFIESYLYNVFLEGRKRNFNYKDSFLCRNNHKETVFIPQHYIEQEVRALNTKISLRDPERFLRISNLLTISLLPLQNIFSRETLLRE